jgi:phenylacetate-CoA ligase
VTGRSDDMMIVRGVNVFPTQVEEQILKVMGLAPHYQIVLTREGRMDEMEVLVEAADPEEGDALRTTAAAELAHHIKSVIGVTARITVANPGGVERSQGKARRVIDKRPNG